METPYLDRLLGNFTSSANHSWRIHVTCRDKYAVIALLPTLSNREAGETEGWFIPGGRGTADEALGNILVSISRNFSNQTFAKLRTAVENLGETPFIVIGVGIPETLEKMERYLQESVRNNNFHDQYKEWINFILHRESRIYLNT